MRAHMTARVTGGDRGSVSLWVVVFAFVTIWLLALVVDGGQVLLVRSRAADIAEQAARAAADDVNRQLLQSGTVAIDAAACAPDGPAAGLVSAYAKGTGVTASMTSCTTGQSAQGPTATVGVQVTATPAIPSGLFRSISEQVTEVAYLACGTANAEQAC
jgi:Flp pilus assembly protein TadG